MQQDTNIVIVGTGFSGIAMGTLLKKAGIDTFTILEKADDIGGTWRDNTYPGAACDIPSHLYSYSFEPKADWSYAYSPQREIQDYLRHCIDKYDLERHIRFGRQVTGGTFDQSSGTWDVETKGGETHTADALVLGNGALHIPNYPKIEGLHDFEGDLFHSARWNHNCDLRENPGDVHGRARRPAAHLQRAHPKETAEDRLAHRLLELVPRGRPQHDALARLHVRILAEDAPTARE